MTPEDGIEKVPAEYLSWFTPDDSGKDGKPVSLASNMNEEGYLIVFLVFALAIVPITPQGGRLA